MVQFAVGYQPVVVQGEVGMDVVGLEEGVEEGGTAGDDSGEGRPGEPGLVDGAVALGREEGRHRSGVLTEQINEHIRRVWPASRRKHWKSGPTRCVPALLLLPMPRCRILALLLVHVLGRIRRRESRTAHRRITGTSRKSRYRLGACLSLCSRRVSRVGRRLLRSEGVSVCISAEQ